MTRQAIKQSNCLKPVARVPASWLPLLRAVKWKCYRHAAMMRARLPWHPERSRPPTFIIGCGRSGTTLLGALLGRHKSVCYLNEPIHYWHAIDPQTDNTGFFGGRGRCVLGADDATELSKARFERLFGQAQLLSRAEMIIEKLPINAFRMEWLRALAPGARFIHIMRDGRAVAHSIDLLARNNRYTLFGMPQHNQWWGNSQYKWHCLACDGMRHHLHSDALRAIGGADASSGICMALYEWLASQQQIESSVTRLALTSRDYLPIRYEDLIVHPKATLATIEVFLDIGCDANIVNAVTDEIVCPLLKAYDIELPPLLYEAFERTQRLLGYSIDGVRTVDDTSLPW